MSTSKVELMSRVSGEPAGGESRVQTKNWLYYVFVNMM